MAKRQGDERKKGCTRCHTRLCGRDHLLKALGSVAYYLADGLFYRILRKFADVEQKLYG